MIEILMLVLFGWLFIKAFRLMLKAAWGITKLMAIVLLIVAFPTLLGVLMIAGGFVLLCPVALIGVAIWILR